MEKDIENEMDSGFPGEPSNMKMFGIAGFSFNGRWSSCTFLKAALIRI